MGPKTVGIALAVLAGLCLSAGGSTAQQAQTQRILILHQDRPTIPSSAINEGFLRTVRRDTTRVREIYTEFLDHARSLDAEHQDSHLSFLRNKFRNRPVDLAVAVGAIPSQLLTDPLRTVAPGAKVIFWINDVDPAAWRHTESAAGGIITHFDISGTIQDILRLLPGTQKLLIVSGVAALDSVVLRQVARELAGAGRLLEIEHMVGATSQQFIRRAGSMPPNSAILFLNFTADSFGNKYMPGDVVAAAATESTAPIFAVTRSLLGTGIVGGRLLDHSAQGQQLGELALQILNETDASKTVRHLAVHRPVYDARALQQWRIHAGRLPDGAELLNRDAVPKELHRRRVIGVLALCLLEALLIGALLVQRRRRAQVEQLLADRLHFEMILADASRTFTNVHPTQIVAETGRWLRRLCAAASARQAMVLTSGSDSQPMHEMASWRGFEATDRASEWIGSDAIRELKKGRVTTVPISERKGAPDLLLVPIAIEGHTLGTLVIEPSTARLFGASVALDRSLLLGEILAGAIARKNAAEELARQADALRVGHIEYRRIADNLIEVQENERKRIARELHDDITQRLTLLSMEAGEISRRAEDSTIIPRSAIEHLTSELGTLVKDVSRVSHCLHPAFLEKVGLSSAIRALCSENAAGSGIPITFKDDDVPHIVPTAASLALYRIGQESLRNALRHSDACLITVRLALADGVLILEVQDNGRGLDADRVRRSQGLGITSMAERIQVLGGSFSVQSRSGGGTLVRASVRLAGTAKDAAPNGSRLEALQG